MRGWQIPGSAGVRFGRPAALGGMLGLAAAGAAGGASAVPSAGAAFPLGVEPGRRYLEDAAGAPFLIHGDTAWSLIAHLREEAEGYLDDRHARGFNTLLVSLIEHRFASHAPANAYGDQPFLAPGDYASPNEAYFAHADRVLRRAGERLPCSVDPLLSSASAAAVRAGTGRWSRMGR